MAEAVALEPRPSRVMYTEAITYFARAIGAARTGDIAGARSSVEKPQQAKAFLAQK